MNQANQNKGPKQFIYVQNKRTKTKPRKNKVRVLNHLLVSSPPTPVNLAIYRLRGQVLPQFGKGPTHNCWNFVCFPFSS